MVQHAAAAPMIPDAEGKDPIEEDLPKAFGKYTLLRKLATGGMAELFLALHRSVAGFEKLVVIKRILPSMNADAAFIEMLLHEARIAATLNHPNIVQIFDVGRIDDRYFIAMEHIHGEDIRSIVRAMKKNDVTEFPLEHTIGIVLGMCAGLSYAHDKRDLDGRTLDIVHRDISPQNIVVTFTGDVKIVDFGIAKSGTQIADETRDGQLKGKVPYMSPEQAAGEAIDWRSDIFATGVMLFELTTGKRLFKGASEYETLKLICERDYPLPTQVRPGYPAQLEQIVMRALAKKREDRYQSAREMQSDIESFVREERLPVSTVSLSKWMQMLFKDKLAQQHVALQDVKQLADVIAVQEAERSALYELQTGTGGGRSAPGATASIPAAEPKRSSAGVWVALVGAIGLGVGGFLYMRRPEPPAIAEPAPPAVETAPVAAEPAPATRGVLEVTSDPAGCSIWVNGDLRQEVTPATIENLPLGSDLQIKLTKEGLESFRETVQLSEAELTKTISATMSEGSVTVLLKVNPPPTIWVDGKPWKGDKAKITGLSAGDRHKIVMSAAGYAPKTIYIEAKQGETKVIEDVLVKGVAASPAPEDPKGGSSPGKSEPAGAPGTVRVGAKGGYCSVTINGAGFGPTPVQASIPAGTATVTCKPENGASMAQSVQVKAGETARVSFVIP